MNRGIIHKLISKAREYLKKVKGLGEGDDEGPEQTTQGATYETIDIVVNLGPIVHVVLR